MYVSLVIDGSSLPFVMFADGEPREIREVSIPFHRFNNASPLCHGEFQRKRSVICVPGL